MSPTIEDLRRYFTSKLERATLQVQQIEEEGKRLPAGSTRWVNLSFWSGVQVAYKEALAALDGIPEDS